MQVYSMSGCYRTEITLHYQPLYNFLTSGWVSNFSETYMLWWYVRIIDVGLYNFECEGYVNKKRTSGMTANSGRYWVNPFSPCTMPLISSHDTAPSPISVDFTNCVLSTMSLLLAPLTTSVFGTRTAPFELDDDVFTTSVLSTRSFPFSLTTTFVFLKDPFWLPGLLSTLVVCTRSLEFEGLTC